MLWCEECKWPWTIWSFFSFPYRTSYYELPLFSFLFVAYEWYSNTFHKPQVWASSQVICGCGEIASAEAISEDVILKQFLFMRVINVIPWLKEGKKLNGFVILWSALATLPRNSFDVRQYSHVAGNVESIAWIQTCIKLLNNETKTDSLQT